LAWKYNKDLTEAEQKAQRVEEPKMEETPKTLSGSNAPTSIRLMEDGPIVVEGNFKIISAENQELKTTLMTSFCRCGASRNMPFCDGTHRKINFTDKSAEDGE